MAFQGMDKIGLGTLIIAAIAVIIGVALFPVIDGVTQTATAITIFESTTSDFQDGTFVNTTLSGGDIVLSQNNTTGTYTSNTFEKPQSTIDTVTVSSTVPTNTSLNLTVSSSTESQTFILAGGSQTFNADVSGESYTVSSEFQRQDNQTTSPELASYELTGQQTGTARTLLSLVGTLFLIGVAFGALQMLGLFNRFGKRF